MITIGSRFELTEPPPSYIRGRNPETTLIPGIRKLVLSGVEIAIRLHGRTYTLATNGTPGDGGFRNRGFSWSRNVVPLRDGVFLEQQMLLANGGNTVALSWWLNRDVAIGVELLATPVFTSKEPTSSEPFRFDPESDGGRLTWQPYHSARRVIADTNGRCTLAALVPAHDHRTDAENASAPATFAFELGHRPAVLIFSVEPEENTVADPILGSFLAALGQPTPHYDDRHLQLAAA